MRIGAECRSRKLDHRWIAEEMGSEIDSRLECASMLISEVQTGRVLDKLGPQAIIYPQDSARG